MKINIFKKLYLGIVLTIIVASFYLAQFLKTYLYDTLYNTQLLVIFKKNIPTPDIVEFESIEQKLKERTAPKDIKWEEINDPFK